MAFFKLISVSALLFVFLLDSSNGASLGLVSELLGEPSTSAADSSASLLDADVALAIGNQVVEKQPEPAVVEPKAEPEPEPAILTPLLEPVVEEVVKPAVVEPLVEPVAEKVVEPAVVEPIAEPLVEKVVEPVVVEQVVEPVVDEVVVPAVVEPLDEPVLEPVVKPVIEPLLPEPTDSKPVPPPKPQPEPISPPKPEPKPEIEEPVTELIEEPVTRPPFVCPSVDESEFFNYNGLYQDSEDCTMFYHCSNGAPTHKSCPAPLVFDIHLGVCNYVTATDTSGCAAPKA